MTASTPGQIASSATPLGPDVFVFAPGMSRDVMQAQIDKVYAEQQFAEFGASRYAFLLLPGDYKLNVPIGFYTQVLGLGSGPDSVHIDGDVRVDASRKDDNATTMFWRAAEGLSVTPPTGTMQWAVSQAVALRRMHVLGSLVLNQRHGWASGGWMADTHVDGTVNSGTQQQWISRNSEWKQWTGANWNMVFVGVTKPPEGEWPQPPFTKTSSTPVIREKPFLVYERGVYAMVVPALQHDASGGTWHSGHTSGKTIPLSHFYIAKPGPGVAASIKRALSQGKKAGSHSGHL